MGWTSCILVAISMASLHMTMGNLFKPLVNNIPVTTFEMGEGNDGFGDATAKAWSGKSACSMITAIRIEYFEMSGIKHIRCIGFTYGDLENSCPAGGSSTAHKVDDLILANNEFITLVSGDFGYDIESIYFKTNRNRALGPYGLGTNPSSHEVQFSNGGAPLLYVGGLTGVWVYSMSFSFSILELEGKTNEVADKAYSTLKANIMDIFKVREQYYCMLPSLAQQGCYYYPQGQNINAQFACDLKTLLDEINLLSTASVSLQNHAPRNLMTLNEYDSQKYLDEVQDAKNFHSLITEIKFGLNTVIAVTDEQSRQLSNYFKSTAEFDQDIAEQDMLFIKGQLAIKAEGAGNTTELVGRRLSSIMEMAGYLGTGNLIAAITTFTMTVMENLNPFRLLFGGPNIGDMMKAFAGILDVIKDLVLLSTLKSCFEEFRDYAYELAEDFAKNQKDIDAMGDMVEVLVNETNADVIQQKANAFVQAYGAYTPQVSNQDIVYVATLMDSVGEEACRLLNEIGGSFGGTVAGVYEAATRNCLYLPADLGVLRSYYEDTYSLQFEMINSLTSIVKGQIAVSMADRIGSIGLKVDIRTVAIGAAIVETKFQAASLARCDILEYLAAGKRPSICDVLLFRDDDIQRLIAYTGSVDYSERTVFAYIPTIPPQDINIPYMNMTKLLTAEYQSFTLPMANKEWMKQYGWLPSAYEPETAFYVTTMEMYLPGVKCNQTGEPIHTVLVTAQSSSPTPLYSETAPPRYTVDKSIVKFEYTEPLQYCAGSTQRFTVRAQDSPVKYDREVCVVSNGNVGSSPKADFTYPSLFTNWIIHVKGHSQCTLVVDKSLDFQPMVTFRMKIKEVFVTGINECWPTGSRCLDNEVCKDRMLSYCCQNSQGVCKQPQSD